MSKTIWVVFDNGGVLLDWRKSSEAVAKELGVLHDDLMHTLFKYAPSMNVGELAPRDGWSKILTDLEVKADPLSIIRRWRAPEFWIKPTLELIKDLNKKGYSLALLSNSWLGLTNVDERQSFPKEISIFKHIIDSSKEGLKKPTKEFYKLAELILGAEPSSIYFIDDDESNLVVPKELGWHTRLFSLDSDNGLSCVNRIRKDLLL